MRRDVEHARDRPRRCAACRCRGARPSRRSRPARRRGARSARRRDRDVVEEAEAHRAVALGVMAGRPHEREAVRRPRPPAPRRSSVEQAAGREARRLVRAAATSPCPGRTRTRGRPRRRRDVARCAPGVCTSAISSSVARRARRAARGRARRPGGRAGRAMRSGRSGMAAPGIVRQHALVEDDRRCRPPSRDDSRRPRSHDSN